MRKNNEINRPQFNSEGAIFMGSKRTSQNCGIGLFGVPYDGTTSFRPGTRFGPSSIREISNAIESYCPRLNIDLNEFNYADLGSLEIPIGSPIPVINCVNAATKYLINNGLKPLIIGGEHSITTGAIEAMAEYYPDLILIQLDAHADLREEWLDSKYSHACTMKRCLEFIPSKHLFQVGIRSGTKAEFDELYKTKRLINTISKTANSLENRLLPFIGKPIYITLDLDWFDPSVLPGTGTPEPGGYLWKDLEEVIKVLSNHKIVGADIVELAPNLDISEISSILGAKAVRSFLILLHLSKVKYK